MGTPWASMKLEIFQLDTDVAWGMSFWSCYYDETAKKYMKLTDKPDKMFSEWEIGKFYMLTGGWLYFKTEDGAAYGIETAFIGDNHEFIKEAMEEGIDVNDLVSIMKL